MWLHSNWWKRGISDLTSRWQWSQDTRSALWMAGPALPVLIKVLPWLHPYLPIAHQRWGTCGPPCYWTTTPTTCDHSPCWLGLMEIGVQQYLESHRFPISTVRKSFLLDCPKAAARGLLGELLVIFLMMVLEAVWVDPSLAESTIKRRWRHSQPQPLIKEQEIPRGKYNRQMKGWSLTQCGCTEVVCKCVWLSVSSRSWLSLPHPHCSTMTLGGKEEERGRLAN